MENEKPLDAHALAEEICRELRSQGLALSSGENRSDTMLQQNDQKSLTGSNISQKQKKSPEIFRFQNFSWSE